MGFESLFCAQLYIMCAFLIFAWIPENYLGCALGFTSSSCLIGALPNNYIGLDEELQQMKWIVGASGAIFLVLAAFDYWFLHTHPYQLDLNIGQSTLSNKIFLYKYVQGEEEVPLRQSNQPIHTNMAIAELFYCKKTLLLATSFSLKLFHDRLMFKN